MAGGVSAGAGEPSASGGRRRVLVAQPSPTLQTLIRMTLSAEDLSVECVADGRRALEVARASPPDLVVADSALPGLDGYALAEALRADPATAAARVLLLVPDYQAPDVERMLHVGVSDALTRPFEQHALRQRVRGLLGPPPARLPDKPPVPAAAPATSSAAVAELVEEAVAARLPGLVEAAVARAIDRAVERLASDALDRAVAQMLGEAPSIALGPKAEAALQAASREVVEAALAARGRQLLGPVIEPIVWKVVPALAEDLLREEIRRLTEEPGGGER